MDGTGTTLIEVPSTPTRDASASVTGAETALREQGMPPAELRIVLTSANPELVHRYLELHVERLEERLMAQRRAVASAERILTDAAERRAS